MYGLQGPMKNNSRKICQKKKRKSVLKLHFKDHYLNIYKQLIFVSFSFQALAYLNNFTVIKTNKQKKKTKIHHKKRSKGVNQEDREREREKVRVKVKPNQIHEMNIIIISENK